MGVGKMKGSGVEEVEEGTGGGSEEDKQREENKNERREGTR